MPQPKFNRKALKSTGTWFLVLTPLILGCTALGELPYASAPQFSLMSLRGNDIQLIPFSSKLLYNTSQKVQIPFHSDTTRLAILHLCGPAPNRQTHCSSRFFQVIPPALPSVFQSKSGAGFLMLVISVSLHHLIGF